MKTLFTLLILCLAPTIPSICQAQIEDSLETKIAKARAVVTQAQNDFDAAKQLWQKSSISKRDFRKAQYLLDKSTIDLAILVDPENEDKNKILGAKVKAQYATEIREIIATLYNSGSASKSALDHSIHVEKVAKLRVEFYENHEDIDAQHLIEFKIAAEKVRLATHEFELSEKLYERGARSKAAFNRSKTSLEIAMAELEQRRDMIGGRAEVID